MVQRVDEAQEELALRREPARMDVPLEMVRAKRNKGAAFTLACDASGLDDKEIYLPLGIDKAVFSKIKSGHVTLDNDLIGPFCELVGNNVYPEWLGYQVGCTLVLIKTEAERQRDAALARAEEAERKLAFASELLRGRAAA